MNETQLQPRLGGVVTRIGAWFSGLFGRILVALVLVGLVPLGWTVVSLVRLNHDAMFDQVQRTHALAARSSAERIASYLATRRGLLRSLAAHADLGDPRAGAGQELLAESLLAWGELGAVALLVVDPQGDEVVRAQRRGAGERIDGALGALRAGDPTATAAGDVRWLPGVAPLLAVREPLAGGVGALLLFAEAQPLVALLEPEELGEAAQLLLIEQSGTGLAPESEDLARWQQQVPPLLREAVLSGLVGGVGRYGEGALETIAAHSPVPGSSWVVLSRQPSRIAEAVARRMARRSQLAVGGSLVLIAALSVAAWRSVVRPLRKVLEAQRRLAGAAVAHERRGAVAGNEVTALAHSLAVLERSMRDRAVLERVSLGRYQVIEVLGSGAMGTVFRGWDPKLERPVALKTLRLGASAQDEIARAELRERLLREAITVAQFNHPNIVGIYDLQESPGAAVLAMELVEGPTLDQLIWQRQRLSVGETVVVGVAIARALAAAHERGVIHRDVKPSNVLLAIDGAIKVSDFGIAELGRQQPSRGGRVFGTPGYLAPELLRGEEASPRSDLFALGVLLHACLVGRGPFEARSTAEVVRRTLRGVGQVSLSARMADVPVALRTLVESLLAEQPSARPASAGAVAAVLDRLADAVGASWTPPSLPRSDGEPGAGETRPVGVTGTPGSGVPTWLRDSPTGFGTAVGVESTRWVEPSLTNPPRDEEPERPETPETR